MSEMTDDGLLDLHPDVADAIRQEGLLAAIQIRRHQDFGRPIRSPVEFASQLGYPIERIVKTLFLRRNPLSAAEEDERDFIRVCLSCNHKIDPDRLAPVLNWPRFEFANTEQLARLLGYPPTGVSPFGSMRIKVLIDASLTAFDTILVGGGKVGVEIEISPEHLATATKAIVSTLR